MSIFSWEWLLPYHEILRTNYEKSKAVTVLYIGHLKENSAAVVSSLCLLKIHLEIKK